MACDAGAAVASSFFRALRGGTAMDSRSLSSEIELPAEGDGVETTLPDRYELDRRAVPAFDGDGVMVGASWCSPASSSLRLR
jgi:hypothetical protein